MPPPVGADAGVFVQRRRGRRGGASQAGGEEGGPRRPPQRPRAIPVLDHPARRQVPGPERRVAGDEPVERQGRLDPPDLRPRRAPGPVGRSRRRGPSRATITLAMRLSYSGGHPVARTRSPLSTRTPGPEGITQRVTRPGVGAKSRAGSSAERRTSMAWLAGSAAARAAASDRIRQRPPRGEAELLADDVDARPPAR